MIRTHRITSVLSIAVFLCLASPPLRAYYLSIFLLYNEGVQFEKSGDPIGALADFQATLDALDSIRIRNPDWETGLVDRKAADCRSEIEKLRLPAARKVTAEVSQLRSAQSPLRQMYADAKQAEEIGQGNEAFKLFERLRFMLGVLRTLDRASPLPLTSEQMADCSAQIDFLARALFTPRASGGTVQ